MVSLIDRNADSFVWREFGGAAVSQLGLAPEMVGEPILVGLL